MAVLPAALTLVGLLFATGMFLADRVAALRPMGHIAAVHRMLDLVLDSGLEEACAAAEDGTPVPLGPRGAPPAALLAAPSSLPLPATRACFAASAITVEPARLTWSDVRSSTATGRGGPVTTALGVVRIAITARARAGRAEVRRTVTVRRYFVLQPSRSGRSRRLLIESRNLGRMVEE